MLTTLLQMVIFFVGVGAEARDVLIVTADVNLASPLDLQQVKAAYLGLPPKASEPDLVALDRKESSTRLRRFFYENVVGRSMTKMKAHWSQLIFTGRGTPPSMAEDLVELKKMLSSTKLSVGFVDGGESTAGLRVLGKVSAKDFREVQGEK